MALGGRGEGSPLRSAGLVREELPQDRTADVLAAVAAERQRQTVAELAESERAVASGEREPWTAALLHLIASMGIDVAALVERYRKRTADRTIDDPNAYLLAMAKGEMAKRVGTTREVVAAVASDRAAMADTAPDSRARAEAENREALARQLGGGDIAAGYAALAMIPDSPHRKRRSVAAGTSRFGATAPASEGAMQIGTLLPTLSVTRGLPAASTAGG